MSEKTHNAKSRGDMIDLSRRLIVSPKSETVFLAASILGEGMMKPQWWMRAIVVFAAWRSKQPTKLVWAEILRRFPEVAEQTLTATANWIVCGKDASKQGVGGFNQAEVEKIAQFLRIATPTSETAA